jgi:hypothetical protein
MDIENYDEVNNEEEYCDECGGGCDGVHAYVEKDKSFEEKIINNIVKIVLSHKASIINGVIKNLMNAIENKPNN